MKNARVAGQPVTPCYVIYMSTDYEIAKNLNLTNIDRWEKGIPHHPKSEQLMAFLKEHDFKDNEDYFDWKVGGDGDNGETLMYQMDAFFEMIDSN